MTRIARVWASAIAAAALVAVLVAASPASGVEGNKAKTKISLGKLGAAGASGKVSSKRAGCEAGRKVTLGGWIGNYGTGPTANMTQVRADFADASGTVLARLRIGNDTTVAGTDMAFRSRKGNIPAGATQVTIVVTFVGGNNYKLAGADDLSLVLA